MSELLVVDPDSGTAVGRIDGDEGLTHATASFQKLWEDEGMFGQVSALNVADDPMGYVTEFASPGDEDYLITVQDALPIRFSTYDPDEVEFPLVREYDELTRKTEWELKVVDGVEGYYNSQTDEFVPTRESSIGISADINEKEEDLWVPYVGPEGGTGWTDGEDITYDDDPPGNSLDGSQALFEVFPSEARDEISNALSEVSREYDLNEDETEQLKQNLVGTYIRTLGLTEDSEGDLQLDNVDEIEHIPIEELAEEMANEVKVEPNQRAAMNIGFDDEQIDEIATEGDVVSVDVDGIADDKQRLMMGFNDTAQAEIVWIGEDYADVVVNDVATQIDDLREIQDIEFADEMDRETVNQYFDGEDVVEEIEDYFGEDSDPANFMANISENAEGNHIYEGMIDRAGRFGYTSDEIRGFIEHMENQAFAYPDTDLIDEWQDDPSASDAPILNALMEMRDEHDYAQRRSDIQDGLDVPYEDASIGERLEAAKEQLNWMEGHEKEFAQRMRDQVTPDTLHRNEVDDVAVGDRLEGSFYFADERHSAREYGIDGGNTTGDEMQVLEYADGSIDFAIPTEAYEQTTTGVVDGKYEAIINNRDSPKVIEALGGSTCKTRIVEDESGKEHIVKEGLEGQELEGIGWEEPELDDPAAESGVETLSAAYFVNNKDLHPSNLFYTEDGEVAVIDHDSSGVKGPSDVISPPTRIGRHGSSAGINQVDVERRAFDKAFKILSGEIELPSEINSAHKDFVEEAAEEAVETAITDSSYVPPGADKSDFEPRITRSREMVEMLDDGDQVNILNPNIGEARSGEVTDVLDDQRVVYIEDEEGYTHEVNGDNLNQTMLAPADTEAERPEPAIDDFSELMAGNRIEVIDDEGREVEAEVLNTFPNANPPFITVDVGGDVIDITDVEDVIDDDVSFGFNPATSSDIEDAIGDELS